MKFWCVNDISFILLRFLGVLTSGCWETNSLEPGPIFLLTRGMRRRSEDSGGLRVRDCWMGGAEISARSLQLDVSPITFVELTLVTLLPASSVSKGPLFLLFF